MLAGLQATKDHFEAVGDTIVRQAQAFGDNDFKIALTKRVVVRALQQAVALRTNE